MPHLNQSASCGLDVIDEGEVFAGIGHEGTVWDVGREQYPAFRMFVVVLGLGESGVAWR